MVTERSWERLSFHSPLPFALRKDVQILLALYAAAILAFLLLDHGLLVLPFVVFCHGLIALSCVWSVTTKCSLQYRKHPDSQGATVVCVIPLPHCGAPAICPLQSDGKTVFFVFQKLKFLLGPDGASAPPLPVGRPLQVYGSAKGLSSTAAAASTSLFGKNYFDIPMPTFGELFSEHAVAPFFVFQIFCVALWCLDEYWYYSLLTLAMLLMFEATVVKRRLKNLADILEMRVAPYPIRVYRDQNWVQLLTTDLVPEDIVSVTRSVRDAMTPCDLLLLSGSCVVNEALLTGESVPQIKEGVDFNETTNLDFKLHKRSILFGGTKVLLHNNSTGRAFQGKQPPDGGTVAMVLRTGFNTDQGKLVRTILFSTERASINNTESLLFLLCLLVFALIASGYVLMKGLENETRSRYKLALNCIMIITSVVPPELPMELSLAVNTSLMALAKLKIYCTEPFRIPWAGAVDVCCFDKTGTLTSDSFIMLGVQTSENADIVTPEQVSEAAKVIIGGCHSLSIVDGEVIGDPLEKSALKAIGWVCRPEGCSAVKPTGSVNRVKILQRFPFSSDLKRMSCVIQLEPENSFRLVSKGAPEMMEGRFVSLPQDYKQTHERLAREGCRVLALGSKVVKQNARTAPREEMEQGLEFAGFLVLTCPLKPDSLASVTALQNSSHRVVIITGDHSLTACHVATELGLTTRTTLVLDGNAEFWVSVDGSQKFPFAAKVHEEFDLCCTGQALQSLMEQKVPEAQVCELARVVSVFARTSPDQKALILTWLKNFGYTTLMCGDGTNDVGALKQAHVGVALIGQDSRNENQDETKRVPPPPQRPKGPNGVNGLEEEGPVRLGDASIASPFTSKVPSIAACVHIIRQGRCTLVTTLQMFQILGINCLISAYSMSVLYLDGVKLGDTQMTISGFSIAMFFLFISRSKPLPTLSEERPEAKVFTVHMALTILGQFAIHMWALISAVNLAKPFTDLSAEAKDPDGKFSPNVLNSVVYLMMTSMTVATFLANYRGRPFMEKLTNNKALFNALVGMDLMMVAAALNLFEPLNDLLELAPFPSPDFGVDLAFFILADLGATLAYATFVRWLSKLLCSKRTRNQRRPQDKKTS